MHIYINTYIIIYVHIQYNYINLLIICNDNLRYQKYLFDMIFLIIYDFTEFQESPSSCTSIKIISYLKPNLKHKILQWTSTKQKY